VPAVDVPNPALTPGAVLTTSAARVCVSGYSSSVRDVPDSEKEAVYARYGVAHVPYQHEVDHLVSLEVGGSNAITNLWPEPYAGRWGARTKDVLENRLHDLVCSGRLSLPFAQHIEATNWAAAYTRYVDGTPAAPAVPARAGDRVRAAGPAEVVEAAGAARRVTRRVWSIMLALTTTATAAAAMARTSRSPVSPTASPAATPTSSTATATATATGRRVGSREGPTIRRV
jgi:hypothetical protein